MPGARTYEYLHAFINNLGFYFISECNGTGLVARPGRPFLKRKMETKESLRQYALQAQEHFLPQNIEKFVVGFHTVENIEIMAISACWLNIGNREEGVNCASWAYNQFMEARTPLQYVLNKRMYWTHFQQNFQKITTYHTLHNWWQLMGRLYNIYSAGNTILTEVIKGIKEKEYANIRGTALEVLFSLFEGIGQMPSAMDLIPNKFVRFVMMMVRAKPIGTGIWTELEPRVFDAKKTYIPLDSGMIKAISDNGLMENPNMSWEFGKSLYGYFAEVFPDDPAQGYFSILGLKDYSHISKKNNG